MHPIFLEGTDLTIMEHEISADLLQNKKHIHFIGIGGSGMFPIAQILHAKGYYLTGSDNNPTDTLELDGEGSIWGLLVFPCRLVLQTEALLRRYEHRGTGSE